MQVKLSFFPCCLLSYAWLQEWGGKLSRAVYLAHHLSIESLIFDALSTCFNLSEYEVVSITIIMQVKLRYFPCCLISYAWLQEWGASRPGWFILPITCMLKVKCLMLIPLVSIYLNMKLYQLQS